MATLKTKKTALLITVIICLIAVTFVGLYIAKFKNETVKPVHLKSGDSHFDWIIDPTSATDLEDEAEIIVEVQYTGEEDTFKEIESPFIKTAYTVNVLNVIKGELEKEQIDIVGYGGEISLDEYVQNSTDEELESDPDIIRMDKKTLAASTIEYTDDFGIDFKKRDIAVVFLNKMDPISGQYPIMCAGLGLFEKTSNDSYINGENNLIIEPNMIENMKQGDV
jgi:hypothetical protein